jgi:hypothetical protein
MKMFRGLKRVASSLHSSTLTHFKPDKTMINSLKAYQTVAQAIKLPKLSGVLGLLTLATLGIAPLPAQAGGYRVTGDSAVVQTSEQRAVITGNGNFVDQNSTQTNIDRRGGGFGNQGVVQDQLQNADVYGHHNQVRQSNRQTTVEADTTRFAPRPRPHYQKKH